MSAPFLANAGPVPREARLTDGAFKRNYRDQMPVILTEVIRHWPAAAWSAATLAARAGEAQVTVRRYRPGQRETFIDQCLQQSAQVRLGDYVDYLEGRRPELLPGEPHTWCLRESDELFGAAPQLGAELPFEGLWPSLGRAFDRFVWLGPGGYVTGLHTDEVPLNLLAHLRGRKRLTLFAPDQTDCLYPVAGEFDGGRYSQVDAYAPDLTRHPAFARAVGLETLLEPGELLYIPSGWWHRVEALEPALSVTGATPGY